MPALLRALNGSNLRFALSALRAQKLRSFLTLLGIVAGVATVIAMVSFVAGFQEAIGGAFTELGATRVRFQQYAPGISSGDLPEGQRPRRELGPEAAEALQGQSTLAEAVSTERGLGGSSETGLTVKNLQGTEAQAPAVLGVTPGYATVNNHGVAEGRFLVDADLHHAARTCLVGEDVRQALWSGQDPLGQSILLNGIPLQVVGVLERKGAFLGGSHDNKVLLPLSTLDALFPENRSAGQNTLRIAVLPRDPEQVEALKEEGVAILRAQRGLRPDQDEDFAVLTSDAGLQAFQEISAGVAATMILIASIALLVGGVGVMNIMLVTVTERTREIGIRKALGATRRDIAAQFLVEALSLTGMGGALGVGLGLGVALLVRVVLDFPVATPLWSVGLGFGVSSAVGLTFGLWPALKAARQHPIEALRYE